MNKKFENYTFLFIQLLSIIVVCLYIFYINHYGLNLPMWDDYDTALRFLIDWHNSHGINQKIQLLFAQHNEHRIILTNLIEIAYFSILGGVNFFTLMIIHNIVILFIVSLIIYSIKKELSFDPYIKSCLVLCTLSLVLSPVQWESQLWYMGGIEAYGQIFCCLLIIKYFDELLKNKNIKYLIIVCVLNFFNMFIAGGFFPLFIAQNIVTLILKRYKLSLCFIIIFSIYCYFYFFYLGYAKLEYPLPSVKQAILFFFCFFGSGVISVKYFALILGVFTLGAIVYYRNIILKYNVLLLWTVMIIVLDLILVRTRSYLGYGSSRYATYSLITYLFLLIYAIKYHIQSKQIKNLHYYVSVFSTICFINFVAFLVYQPRTDLFKWRYLTTKNQVFYPNIKKAESIYFEAKEIGIYSSPHLDENIKKLNK